MASRFIYGLLAGLVVTLMSCHGPEAVPVNVRGGQSSGTPSGMSSGMATFCQATHRPVNVRRRVAVKLRVLSQAIDEELDDTDRSMASYVNNENTFPEQQTMSSLISDLDRTVNSLICMGRALDITCPPNHHHHNHHRRCRASLYRQHVLPHNARRLRSNEGFQRSFLEVVQDMEQLRASVEGEGARRGSEGCAAWQGNSAWVLTFSYAFIGFARGLMEDVALSCVEVVG